MNIPIAGEREVRVNNCVINQVLIYSSTAANHNFYAVRHLETNQVIDVISLVQAFRVAKLLDLEWLVFRWVDLGKE